MVSIFFLRKCPDALELNLKPTNLTNVVEQTRNVSTWSDRSKKLPSTTCFFRDTKIKRTLLESGPGFLAKEHKKNPSHGHTMVPWALRALGTKSEGGHFVTYYTSQKKKRLGEDTS